MYRTQTARRIIGLATATALVVTLAVAAPFKALADTTPTTPPAQSGLVRVWQHLDYSHAPYDVRREFTYELIPVTPGAPMPADSTHGVYSWKLVNEEHKDLYIPTNGKTGIFTYTMRQKPITLGSAYTLDTTEYEVIMQVMSNPFRVKTISKTPIGEKASDPGWTVTYTGDPTTPSTGGGATPGGGDTTPGGGTTPGGSTTDPTNPGTDPTTTPASVDGAKKPAGDTNPVAQIISSVQKPASQVMSRLSKTGDILGAIVLAMFALALVSLIIVVILWIKRKKSAEPKPLHAEASEDTTSVDDDTEL